jgi:hypothetical protein
MAENISDLYKKKVNNKLIYDIIINVYEKIKVNEQDNNEFTIDENKIKNFIINKKNPQTVKFIYKNFKNIKKLYPKFKSEFNTYKYPPCVYQFFLDAYRTEFYNARTGEFYSLNNEDLNNEDHMKIYAYYKLLKSIYGELIPIRDDITAKTFKTIIETREYWNPIFFDIDKYSAETDLDFTSLFSNDPEYNVDDDIKLVFYFCIMLMQTLDASLMNQTSDESNVNNMHIWNNIGFTNNKLTILDIFDNKPYLTIGSNLCSTLNIFITDENNKDINYNSLITCGYGFNTCSIDDIANKDAKFVLKLLYKPNDNNTIMEDCIEYAKILFKELGNINIFRCLTEEQAKAIKADTKKGESVGLAKEMYTTYRPKDDTYKSASCSGRSKYTRWGKHPDEPEAKYDLNCTYGDMLNYVDNLTDFCFQLTKYKLFEEINKFINKEFYKYMPICFIFSINIHICNKLFKGLAPEDYINFNRQFVIQIREFTPYVKYIDTFEEFALDSLKPQDAESLPLLNISKYHKLFFIVSTEDIDDIACPWLKEKEKEKEKFDLGDPWLPIYSMKKILEKSFRYQKIFDFEMKYIPVFVSSNFIKNILSISLLYTYLNDKLNAAKINSVFINDFNYYNFDHITDSLLMISFNRIILELLDYIKKLKPDLQYLKFNEIMNKINDEIDEKIIVEQIDESSTVNPTEIKLLKEKFDSVKTMMAFNLSAEQIFKYCIEKNKLTDVNVVLQKLNNITSSLQAHKSQQQPHASVQPVSAQPVSVQPASVQPVSDQKAGSRMRLGIRNKKTKNTLKTYEEHMKKIL